MIKEFFKGFKKGTSEFGNSIIIIINSFLLSVVYLVGVGVTSIIAKLIGKNFLDIKLTKEKKTYWSDLGLKKKPINEYYRQF